MPPAIPVDQELLLKKRARRRLVGAIALVMLLMIILPIVLKDRVKSISNEHANITMDEGADLNHLPPAFEVESENSQTVQTIDETNNSVPKVEAEATLSPSTLNTENNQANQVDESNDAKVLAKTSSEDLIANKVAELERKQTADSNSSVIKEQDNKQQPTSAYTIQVGAFSDLSNMKQTQVSLTKAGFTTTTEKVTTPKGDSIRLMAGNYTTRESANEALLKLKSIGLDGMIKPKNNYDKSIVRN